MRLRSLPLSRWVRSPALCALRGGRKADLAARGHGHPSRAPMWGGTRACSLQYGAHLVPFSPDDADDFKLPTEKSLKVIERGGVEPRAGLLRAQRACVAAAGETARHRLLPEHGWVASRCPQLRHGGLSEGNPRRPLHTLPAPAPISRCPAHTSRSWWASWTPPGVASHGTSTWGWVCRRGLPMLFAGAICQRGLPMRFANAVRQRGQRMHQPCRHQQLQPGAPASRLPCRCFVRRRTRAGS